LEVFTFISDDRYFNDRYFYDHYFLAEEWGGQSERVVFSRSDFDFVFLLLVFAGRLKMFSFYEC